MEAIRDEPVSPAGRLLLQPKFNLIISCAVGFEHPLNIENFKTDVSNSLMLKHPRFSSLLVVDKKGREFWRKTQISLDDHIIIHHKNPLIDYESDEETNINSILADFAVSSPLSNDKPLWEIHVINELKCVILRVHHSLGDGISLMSLFLDTCDQLYANADYKDNGGNVGAKNDEECSGPKKWAKIGLFVKLLRIIWYTIVSVIGFIGRCSCVKDAKTAISGGDGVELWPRLASTAKFSLQDMKIVKRAIPNATINDVLFGVISSGFSKYMHIRSAHALQEGLQITGIAYVNLRKQPGLQEMSKLMEDNQASWGNQVGIMFLPVYCYTKDADPLNFVKRAKAMIDQKKQSLEAHFTYNIGYLTMFLFGSKVTTFLNYRAFCNTTFGISNVAGPPVKLAFRGNPIKYIRATTSSFPHAISMLMLSYAGIANMQILVAKEIIPDPKFLAQCFEDALLDMKNAAMNVDIDVAT